MEFSTVVEQSGRSATGLVVPPEIVEALGAGRKPPVTVTVNGGHVYRSSIASMGGRYLISLSSENRTKAGVAAGDTVLVDVVLDTEPRVVTVPGDFAAALDDVPAARARFDALSYSHQLQHVLAIDGAKTPATRQRRIDGAIAALRG